MPYATGSVPHRPIDLRVAADPGLLPVVRVVPETVALMGDFDVDRVADLTLAVDQVCADLVSHAVDRAELVLRIQPRAMALIVSAATDTRTDAVPDRSGFGWRVLQTLTDHLSVEHTRTVTGGCRTEIVFTLLRSDPG